MRNYRAVMGLLAGLASVALGGGAAQATYAYTYAYTGPAFVANAGNVSMTLTLPAPLSGSTSYSGLPPGTTVATIKVTSTNPNGNFSLPVSNFAITTDASGNIASWSIWSNSSNISGAFPQSGTSHMAESVNTLSTTVPLPYGVKTHSATDFASIITDYKSCVGVSGCTISSTGQPMVTVYSGVETGAVGKWTLTRFVVGSGCGGGTGGSGGGGCNLREHEGE